MSSGPQRFVTHLNAPLPQEVRDLYAFTSPSQFGHLSDEELAKHITSVRDKAYKVAPWPCLGGFRFLLPGIANAGTADTYPSVVAHLKSNPEAQVLDLGCCFGHDARQLIKDGVLPSQVVACDLLPELLQYGFELFGDKKDEGHLKGLVWEKVDVFNQQDIEKIKRAHGYHAIYIGSFIHLFPLTWQQKVVATLDELLSKEKGSTIWGRQVGVEEGMAGPMNRIVKNSRGPIGIEADENGDRESPYYHDVNTLKQLFKDGAAGTNVWDDQVELYDWRREKSSVALVGDGEQMIAPEQVSRMKRLAFSFVRK